MQNICSMTWLNLKYWWPFIYVVWFMTLGNYLCVSVKHSRELPFVFGHPSPSRRSVCQLAEHSADHIHTFHHSTKENVMLNAEEALLLLPFSNFGDYTLRLLPSLKLEKVLGSRHGIQHIINAWWQGPGDTCPKCMPWLYVKHNCSQKLWNIMAFSIFTTLH